MWRSYVHVYPTPTLHTGRCAVYPEFSPNPKLKKLRTRGSKQARGLQLPTMQGGLLPAALGDPVNNTDNTISVIV